MSTKTKSNVTYLNTGQFKARKYTNHALKRSSQRGVSETAIEYVLEYGTSKYDGRGGVVHFLNKKEKKYINKNEQEVFKDLERFKNLFVVTSSTSGEVITVGHRYRRIFN